MERMRLLVHALTFCGVFLLVSRAVGLAIEGADLHVEEPGTKSLKSDHYRAHAEEIDLLFVGSSRIFRQYDPRTFEETAAEKGLELDAYNMGAPGMRFFESLAFVDWILGRPSARRRWILFELQDPEPTANEGLRYTQRNVRWHTPRLAARATSRVLASQREIEEKLSESAGHLGQALLRASNAGTALPALRDLFGWRRIARATTGTGFVPLDLVRTGDVRRRRAELEHELGKDPRFFQEKAQAYAAATPAEAPAWMLEELQALVSRAKERGVELVFVISPPSEENFLALSALSRDPTLPRVFLYDPGKYPLLYFERGLRFDHNHLNLEGAEKLTELLARQFVRHVKRTDG